MVDQADENQLTCSEISWRNQWGSSPFSWVMFDPNVKLVWFWKQFGRITHGHSLFANLSRLETWCCHWGKMIMFSLTWHSREQGNGTIWLMHFFFFFFCWAKLSAMSCGYVAKWLRIHKILSQLPHMKAGGGRLTLKGTGLRLSKATPLEPWQRTLRACAWTLGTHCSKHHRNSGRVCTWQGMRGTCPDSMRTRRSGQLSVEASCCTR